MYGLQMEAILQKSARNLTHLPSSKYTQIPTGLSFLNQGD
jgi:hypothetical protein